MDRGLFSIGAVAVALRRRRPRPRHFHPPRLIVIVPRGFCSQQSTDGSRPPKGRLGAFAADWNAALAGCPQAVVATFLSAQSTTWLGTYVSLSAIDATLPPSLAAGWVVAKFSKKFRQPANAALAAILVGAVPTLGEVKVTPLVTGFVMGDKDRKVVKERIGENAPSVTPIIDAASRGAKWLEGPVDKYGLSYYLSSRISGVATIGVSAYLVHQGVDVGAHLFDWGVGEGVGAAVGTAAAASMCNVCFLPLHFLASVYGVRALEGAMRATAEEIVDGKIEAEREFRRNYEREDEDKKSGDGHRESEYERVSDGAMRSATLLLMMYSLMVSLYSFRLLGETATASGLKDDEDKSNGQHEEGLVKRRIQLE